MIKKKPLFYIAAIIFLLLLPLFSLGCGKRSSVYREPVHYPEFVEGGAFSENPAKFKGKEIQFVARVIDVDGSFLQAQMHTDGPRLLVEGKGLNSMTARPTPGDYIRIYGTVQNEDRAGYIAIIDAYKVTVPRWSELMRTAKSLRSDDGHVEVQILAAATGRDFLNIKEGSISLMPESAATRISDIAFIGMTLKIRGKIHDDGTGDFDYLDRSARPTRSGFTLDLDENGTAVFKTDALFIPTEYEEALRAVGAAGDGTIMLKEGTTYRLHYR